MDKNIKINSNIIDKNSIIPALNLASKIANCIETPESLLQNKILSERIANIFMTIGIPAHLNGYRFLREAAYIAVSNYDKLNSSMKKIYLLIASRYNTNVNIVERSIRNAIEIACRRGKMVNFNTIFGITIFERNDKPTNSELIALLVERLHLDCT